MSVKLLAGLSAVVFAGLSTAAYAGCAGHTAETATPITTAQISTPSDSGSTKEVKPN